MAQLWSFLCVQCPVWLFFFNQIAISDFVGLFFSTQIAWLAGALMRISHSFGCACDEEQ